VLSDSSLISRILVVLDGSEHAQHALNYAIIIAAKFDAWLARASIHYRPDLNDAHVINYIWNKSAGRGI
jgi:nucleotide-binding universal stress UspA family protein